MGEVIPMRAIGHDQLGRLAMEALEQGRTQLALCHLAQAWLDASGDRQEAWVVAKRINALARHVDSDGAA